MPDGRAEPESIRRMMEAVLPISEEQIDEFHFSNQLDFLFSDSLKCFRILGLRGCVPDKVLFQLIDAGGENPANMVGEVHVSSTHPVFPYVVRLTIPGDRAREVRQALDGFFKEVMS